MNVKVANSAGFCFGVKRAVALVYQEASRNIMPLYTYGPIIHNEEVVKDLEKLGVKVIDENTVLEDLPNGKIIIRSHGVTKAIQDQFLNSHFIVEDATCPFVKRIHNTVSEYGANGYTIVIIGNKEHPEVIGICGWSQSTRTVVIDSIEEANDFSANEHEKICIVAQTTYNIIKFQELVEIITKKGYDINVINTICNATSERQEEARQLAKECDAMIVVGSLTSSNTRKLFDICKTECANTYYIQTINDLDFKSNQETHSVGITAGASTPNKIIEEVQTYVRNEL